MTIIEHLETNLGLIAEGWKDDSATGDVLQVVRFADQPCKGASTFSTIGLSESKVLLSKGKYCRQEFIFAAWDSYPAAHVASFLLTFATYVRDQKRPLLRGDVVGPSVPLIPGVAADSIYATSPVIFPEPLVCYDGDAIPTVIVWLVPLIEAECLFVKEHGWNRFEDALENANPDLFDLSRLSIV
ncbi:suppressor of fused domain protein [Paraburkholderia sp. UCT2]|uniref:suppressor of fused domain protein n=1 Tax=Paraburkholderia sp. UCT2 TaxID=2615208 RepID=UPI001655D86A|nr:suppressor of fused domain protein [Paraburkholderia sp. UCT2]MBC8733041.1 suppressor of fused domain protein [Paraburkholderia sp. UCT2]